MNLITFRGGENFSKAPYQGSQGCKILIVYARLMIAYNTHRIHGQIISYFDLCVLFLSIF